MHTVWDESGRSAPLSAGRRLAMAALCAAGLTLGGAAQAESMEEKLRAQLRSTTQQLQQMQSEQARSTPPRRRPRRSATRRRRSWKPCAVSLPAPRARPRSCRSSRAPCWKAPSRRSPPATPSWASSRAPTTSCWSWRAPRKASAPGRRAGPARRAGQELRRQEPRDVPGRQGHPECLRARQHGRHDGHAPALRAARA